MKKLASILLVFLTALSPMMADELSDYQKDVDSIYRQGAGAQDGGYSAIALSMFGWGIGLAAGIAILFAVLHQSKASSSHNNSSHCH